MDDRGVKKPARQYAETIDYSVMVRDSIQGEAVIKRDDKIKKYLPDPCGHIKDQKERDERYRRYANSAEYDDIPAQTLESIVGSVFKKDVNYDDIPASMKYMIDDADGDGLSMDELLKIGLSELLSQNYFGMLAEYSDLSSFGIEDEQITVAQARELGLRPSIRIYPRESIRNWNYRRVNGVLQLSFLILKEVEEVQKPGSFETEKVDCYLVLGLDADGEYYQQKYIDDGDDSKWSEIYYPEAGGKKLNFIPFEICIGENIPKGKLPSRLGYLAPICSKTLHRFRMSADMKECMYLNGAPLTWSSNWTDQGMALYKEMTGNDYISTAPGSHLPLPQDSSAGIISWDSSTSAYADYMERNEGEIRALGGKYDTTENEGSEETATAAIIKAADKSGALSNAVTNLQKSVGKIISYCAMFNGEEFSGNIGINREFYKNKLTSQERTNILAEWQSGFITQKEALLQMERGGVLISDADAILSEFQNTGE